MGFDLDRYRRRLRARRIGVALRYRERTGSTMDDARAAADREGAASCGTAYVAGEQTAGRGRQGRSWISAAESGLYVTYHLCPSLSGKQLDRLPLISVAGAVAAADAIESSVSVHLDVKWPNDLLHEGRKLAGVLAESRLGPHGAEVFLGIGVNLRAGAALPEEIAAIATSVEEAGAAPAPPPEDLLAALSGALERRVAQVESDPSQLLADWRTRLITLGRRVRLAAPAGEVEGEAIDVTWQGELVLRLEDGREIAFSAGDVHSV